MKYGSEIICLMRPYPGREFPIGQIVKDASRGRKLTAREYESVRKGVRRVLEHLVETGQVIRHGDGRATLYSWQGLGHEVPKKSCSLGRQLGQ